mmetsp:Transcript_19737/g.64579  ORF Transcript_19737/g.64579 Transcript_19737/m.64579 type:complete len:466 (-) Transcript_19737:210-1607(-)
MGTAKRFDMERGFGFIVPDDGGEDIFAHGNALTDGNALREGARVCFRKSYDPVKNKAAAEEVTGAYIDPMRAPPRGMGPVPPGMGGAPRGPPLGEPAPPPGKMMGTAKRFNMEKGFGFIIPDGGGDDIFVHAMNITDGNALREGARICFKTGVDERKNKARAEEVTGGYVDPSRPPPGAASRGGMPPMPYGAPPPALHAPPPSYGYDQNGGYGGMPGYGAMPPGYSYQPPPTPQYPAYGQQYAAAPDPYGQSPAAAQHHAQHPAYAAQQWSACSAAAAAGAVAMAAAVSGAGAGAAFVPPAEMQPKEQRAAAEFDRPEAQAAEAAEEEAATAGDEEARAAGASKRGKMVCPPGSARSPRYSSAVSSRVGARFRSWCMLRPAERLPVRATCTNSPGTLAARPTRVEPGSRPNCWMMCGPARSCASGSVFELYSRGALLPALPGGSARRTSSSCAACPNRAASVGAT